MPTASETASSEAAFWSGISTRWARETIPDLWPLRPPIERDVVVFHDPSDDLDRRAHAWSFSFHTYAVDELAAFASGLAAAEAAAWEDDQPDVATRAFETRRFLLADRLFHWLVPWLHAVGRAGSTDAADGDAAALLDLGDRFRIAPNVAGTEGLFVPGEDTYGPTELDGPLDALVTSVWSGWVILDSAATVPDMGLFEEASRHWNDVANASPGSALLWRHLSARADRTAALLAGV